MLRRGPGASARLLAALTAVLLAVHGLLPQAHLAWGHAHETSAAAEPSHACHDGCGDAVAATADDACQICAALLAAPPMGMPALPAPEPPAAAFDSIRSPSAGAHVAGVVIRWSLARGPPAV